MSDAHQAAAMWGIAENVAFPIADRLACALQALEFYGAEYERHEDDDATTPSSG